MNPSILQFRSIDAAPQGVTFAFPQDWTNALPSVSAGGPASVMPSISYVTPQLTQVDDSSEQASDDEN